MKIVIEGWTLHAEACREELAARDAIIAEQVYCIRQLEATNDILTAQIERLGHALKAAQEVNHLVETVQVMCG